VLRSRIEDACVRAVQEGNRARARRNHASFSYLAIENGGGSQHDTRCYTIHDTRCTMQEDGAMHRGRGEERNEPKSAATSDVGRGEERNEPKSAATSDVA